MQPSIATKVSGVQCKWLSSVSNQATLSNRLCISNREIFLIANNFLQVTWSLRTHQGPFIRFLFFNEKYFFVLSVISFLNSRIFTLSLCLSGRQGCLKTVKSFHILV